MFRVGQKVVCVDASGDVDPLPLLNAIYTIASIRYIGPDISFESGWGVTLLELPTVESDEYFAEYRAERFRPIVDRPTDISVFKEMLHPSKIAEACDV